MKLIIAICVKVWCVCVCVCVCVCACVRVCAVKVTEILTKPRGRARTCPRNPTCASFV